jgi:hypothetical protein
MPYTMLGFNPCFDGTFSSTGPLGTQAGIGPMFQSLF